MQKLSFGKNLTSLGARFLNLKMDQLYGLKLNRFLN